MRSGTITKTLSLLLALLLAFTSIPFNQINASAAEGEQTPVQAEPRVQEEPLDPPAPELPKTASKEVTNLRTENSTTFKNSDGSYTKEIFSKPVFVEEEGNLEEISTDVDKEVIQQSGKSEEVIQPKSTLIDFFFKPIAEKGHYVTFKQNGHQLSYSLLSAEGEAGEITTSSQPAVNAEYTDNKITYENILPNLSLRNVVFNDSVKEDIILSKYQGHNTFNFNIETNLTARITEEGEISFLDNNEEEIYRLPKPFMNDSNMDSASGESQKSENVQYHLEKSSTGWILSVIADDAWLKDESRVYPVYIDPTTKIFETTDTYVSSAYPTTNYEGSRAWDSGLGMYVLKVGNYDSTTGNNFAFLKQDVTRYQYANIDWAKLNVFTTHSYYPTTPTGVWLDKVNGSWNAGTLTWNTKPSTSNLTSVNVYKGQWATFDITDTLQDWVSGKQANNGFMLHTNGNGQSYWKKFVSSENTGYDKAPHLNISYSYLAPINFKASTYNLGDNTGYIDLSWNEVKGAIKYRVWIFNGKEYKPYDVGNRTSWSTLDRSIWPDQGKNLPTNPQSYYKSSGGDTYIDRRNYAISVSAIMTSGEESLLADPITPYIPLVSEPTAPEVTAYSNGNETGYFDLKWKPVLNATGYKVWIFNGISYESFDVSNVTQWSTKEQHIWPNKSEIENGRYLLHHLPTEIGSEMVTNPSPVYLNSGGRYPTNKNYWFKVSAYNSQGESIPSVPVTPSLPTEIFSPEGSAFTLDDDLNKGFIEIEWDEISGAKGYKVWLFNGKEYEPIDVGNTTSWSSLDAGLWPTIEERQLGHYKLHLDGTGEDLPLDPSQVYKNSLGKYGDSKNYWIRVSGYGEFGESEMSAAFMPTIIPLPENIDEFTDENYTDFKENIYGLPSSLETEVSIQYYNELTPFFSEMPEPEIDTEEEVVFEEDNIEPIKDLSNEGTAVPLKLTPYQINFDRINGNLIETYLDLDEGVSKINITKIGVNYQYQAKDISAAQYPNSKWLKDAYRHFTWNFLSFKGTGYKAAKIVTTNHEWGMALLNPSRNYYTSQYNYYKKKGWESNKSAQYAFADMLGWLTEGKEYALTISKANYAFFKKFFSKGNIMDFNNNHYGRNYANKFSSVSSAFTAAKNKGYLITDETKVTDFHYKKIWNTKRYY
ncbi:DNRLRE domain-containing protein [Bacillus sp. SJS]|uniref:DNRLRE domain-containing protein n=1 Tax=Bacillus sp. SJS TaxID=1423321 RepID=UPI0004DCE8B7|nr:DNRLRE domain-containing protein [Bacillus sp. SJS]KZZ85186.1 hypothetical protein AS29_006870 [Bacillus sp. SJS]